MPLKAFYFCYSLFNVGESCKNVIQNCIAPNNIDNEGAGRVNILKNRLNGNIWLDKLRVHMFFFAAIVAPIHL